MAITAPLNLLIMALNLQFTALNLQCMALNLLIMARAIFRLHLLPMAMLTGLLHIIRTLPFPPRCLLQMPRWPRLPTLHPMKNLYTCDDSIHEVIKAITQLSLVIGQPRLKFNIFKEDLYRSLVNLLFCIKYDDSLQGIELITKLMQSKNPFFAEVQLSVSV